MMKLKKKLSFQQPRRQMVSTAQNVAILVKGALLRNRIPTEVSRIVLDYAELYVTLRVQGTVELHEVMYANESLVTATVPANLRNRFYGVRVECESHDQGWASSKASWTWLELLVSTVGVTDATGNAGPDGQTTNVSAIVRNETANSTWQAHDVTQRAVWLEQMLPGTDLLISVQARSEFPGWAISTRPATLTLLFNNSSVL